MKMDKYDAVIVGTGFASTFFLHRYLRNSSNSVRVLVLERGQASTHREQLAGKRDELEKQARQAFINRSLPKRWRFLLTFGGGSNCWYACTPRMLPEDFRLQSLYGVGTDWPVSYEELDPYYCDAEEMMAVAGSPDAAVLFPRSRPYPQPPHQFSDVDRVLKTAYPDQFFTQPTARPSKATPNRPRCCTNSICTLCPIDSKFTVLNELESLYKDPRVRLVLGADVKRVDVSGGNVARGVTYLKAGAMQRAQGETVVLGANAIFNPHIMLSSGFEHPELGKGLGEQVSKTVVVHLDGVDNFQGSTVTTGHGYMMHLGQRRADRAAGLIEVSNKPVLRKERGKWRQIAHLRVIFEDLRRPENFVRPSKENPDIPETVFEGHSAYAGRGLAALQDDLQRVLAPLPVEEVFVPEESHSTESHIQGTTPMGSDPATSIVDRHLVHHQVRNLLVLGSGAFPTAAPANPSLTISALALRSADYVTGKQPPT